MEAGQGVAKPNAKVGTISIAVDRENLLCRQQANDILELKENLLMQVKLDTDYTAEI